MCHDHPVQLSCQDLSLREEERSWELLTCPQDQFFFNIFFLRIVYCPYIHVTVIPLYFFLAGAKKTFTYTVDCDNQKADLSIAWYFKATRCVTLGTTITGTPKTQG